MILTLVVLLVKQNHFNNFQQCLQAPKETSTKKAAKFMPQKPKFTAPLIKRTKKYLTSKDSSVNDKKKHKLMVK